jgi:replicative DNA helicase
MQQQEAIIPQNLSMQEVFLLNDVVSEKGVLGCIMKEPKLIVEAERLVAQEAFSFTGHRYIFQLMLWMYREAMRNNWQLGYDRITMLSALKYLGPAVEQFFLPGTEGSEQLRSIDLMLSMVDTRQFKQYVHQLNDRYQRRQMYMAMRQHQLQLLDLKNNPSGRGVAMKAAGAFSKLAVSAGPDDEATLRRYGEYQDPLIKKSRIAQAYPHAGLFNVYCGLTPYLMTLMNGGFVRKGLVMVCARPKVGKSSLLLAWAIAMALGMPDPVTGQPTCEPSPVCYLDTEMSGEEQMSRGLSNVLGVNEFDILKGRWLSEGVVPPQHQQMLEALRKAPFFYARIAGKPMSYVQSLMRQFRNEHVGTRELIDPVTKEASTYSNNGTVFYDWMKLPDADNRGQDKEYVLLGDIASKIKDTGAELDIPVVAGAQANRGAVGVSATDWEHNAEAYVAGSDKIAQFCSILMILRNTLAEENAVIKEKWGCRPNKTYEQHGNNALAYNQVLHVVLQRRGPDFRRGIPLYLDRGHARYEEMACAKDEQGRFVLDQYGQPTPSPLLTWMAENAGKKLVALTTEAKKSGTVPKGQAIITQAGGSGGGVSASPMPLQAEVPPQ